jgi:thiamine biosynthesis lipoprotein ApbE
MAADALSTALYAMPLADARYLVDGTEGCGAWFTLPDGTIVAHGATREFDRLAKSRANLLRRGAAP